MIVYREGKVFKWSCLNCSEVQLQFIFIRSPFQVQCQKCESGFRIPLSTKTEDLLHDMKWYL